MRVHRLLTNIQRDDCESCCWLLIVLKKLTISSNLLARLGLSFPVVFPISFSKWPVARLPSVTIESLNLGISWLRPLASS